ncbi:MAG: cytochrome b [Gammaproteobacteria bacterium]|nr:cytochrome b [Gammaproteobacteria bacterium]
MNTPNSSNRYSQLSISAHWLTFLLLIAVYALIELRGIYPKGSDPREAMKAWHNTLGLVVFLLLFIRLAARVARPAPPITPTPPAWQATLSRLVLAALYLFLLVMPVLGWLMLSAQGKPIPFFGLELPALIAPDEGLGKNLEEIHESIGTIGYFLVGLHAVAALYHHYFVRDDALRRMLPGR